MVMSVGMVPLPVAPVKAPFPSCSTSSPKLFTCRTSGKSLKSLPPTTLPAARLVSRYRNANSFTFISFADPHPLSSVVSYRYKNSGGGGPLDAAANRRSFFARCPNPFALNLFADPHVLSPVVSYFYEKVGGRVAGPFRFSGFSNLPNSEKDSSYQKVAVPKTAFVILRLTT